jgi:hypothetical protein
MNFILAGTIGALALSVGVLGAYFGGALGWFAVERSWLQVAFSRRQWLFVCVAMGFVSSLGGGLVGADLATGHYLPWVTNDFSQLLDSRFMFAIFGLR